MAPESTLEFIGLASLVVFGGKLACSILSFFYRRIIATPFDLRKSGGEWALVTGATDGIGKAYAFALAKKGLNIILVSRTPFKLQNVAADIESKYKGIKTKIVDIDFANSTSAEYLPRVEEAIRGLKVGVLVNNVGMSYDHPEPFLNITPQRVDDLIRVNIVTVNELTRLILPQMVERKKGAIINISSMSGAMCTPLLTVYAGTKAYVDRFTEGLVMEYGNKGIVIQCILPGPVVSNMSKIRRPDVVTPLPEAFVASCLARLGIESRTTGYWSHDMMLWAVNSFLPEFISKKMTYGQLSAIRAKALKKLAKNN